MKITNISCTQFAGVRERNVSLTDGINIVYGKNESGKSTLVNLLSRTLFQSAKLDRRSDKEFFELYFPGTKKGSSVTGDFADGKITFETGSGTYTLSKEWGADARCTLSTPDGVIRAQGKIDEVLKEQLLYGEGVYADMLFSSQRNTDSSLQTILDASRKSDAKQELTNAVSQAFAESDGISVEAIGQAIRAKIDEIAGKHWDFNREAPVRKAGRWSTGQGEILKAFYALEDAQDSLEEISRLEREADRTANAYTSADIAARTAEDAYSRFHGFASRLAVQNERRNTIERLDRELQKMTQVLSGWPVSTEKLEKAKQLQEEKANRHMLDIWNTASAIRAELSSDDLETAALPCPEAAELSAVRTAQREITALGNKLCGMNLHAAIRMLGGNSIAVTSLRTGEPVDVSGGLAAITEAVRLEIPGVMEMQLAPADVNVAQIEAQIARQKQDVSGIFAAYKVQSVEELEDYTRKIADAKAKIERINNRLRQVLGNMSFSQLEALCAPADSAVRSGEEIERDILSVCGSVDIARFITKTETVLDGYAAEYGSIHDLKAKAFDLDAQLKKARASVSDADDIPVEYRSIADPEDHLLALQHDLKSKQKLREAALTDKTSAASRLEAYKDAHPEACPENAEKAAREFEETKSLLKHWLHIEKVFRTQKENIRDNPMQNIAERFAHYLSIITGGRVSSEFPETDKLNMHIYSDNRLLDYGKLSEGTKETVSLAFRLAVLDHLFPEGGGVIVFDDPLTDLDAERTAQACRLISACAKRHQVIFLTCKEEYLNALEGNRILF